MFIGDVYAATHLPRVADTLAEAADRLSHSEFARAAFGNAVVDHYVRAAEVETEAASKAVTDWERARYFERI